MVSTRAWVGCCHMKMGGYAGVYWTAVSYKPRRWVQL